MRCWLGSLTTAESVPLLFLLLAGCAVGSAGYRVPEMVPRDVKTNPTPFSARVSAKADETTWSRMLRVPDDVFLRAVQESLAGSRIFSEVVTEGEADYALDVRITELDQPIGGTDMTVNVSARWVLTDLATGKVTIDEEILASNTVPARTAFSATERVRLATEAAIRANIERGLRRIGAEKLGQ